MQDLKPSRAVVVHGKGVNVQRRVAARKRAQVDALAMPALARQGGVEIGREIKPLGSVGIQALTQGRARGHHRHAQYALKERIIPVRLDGIEIALALAVMPPINYENPNND